MIGILLNTWTYNHITNDMDTFENIQFYRQFSQVNQVPLCLYCMQGVPAGRPYLKGLAIDPATSSISEQRIPWPKYNFCRAVLSKSNVKIMETYAQKYDLRFYQLQSTEERNKLKHLDYLRQNHDLRGHLPDTAPLTESSLMNMLKKHGKVIIKPVKGWLGKNIVLIEQEGEAFFVNSIELSMGGGSAISSGELIRFFYRRYRRPRGYMVQQKIDAHTFDGRVSECRVSVQKREGEYWDVTGIAVRLAQPGRQITNIRQGADAVQYQSLFPGNKLVFQEIINLSVAIAKELEKHMEIIDLGLDLMLDHKCHVWFIEANLRDQRLTYKAANDMDTWYRTTTAPLAYILNHAMQQQSPSFITNLANVFRRLFNVNNG